jgi:Zn-dependent protease
MQRKRGLEFGRPFGFPLLVHRSWFGAGALLVVHLASTSFGADSLPIAMIAGILAAAAVFGSVVVHEGAHALVRRWTGVTTVDATLFVFGGVARTVGEPGGRGRDAAVALAGPVTNGALAAGAFILQSSVGGHLSEALWTIGVANTVFALLNLLPAMPLDGGQLLTSVLWRRRGWDRSHAVRAAARGGEVLGTATLLTGAWLTFTSISTIPDAALGFWLLLVGAVLASEAARTRRAANVASLMADATAGSWARPFTGKLRSETPVPSEGGPYAVSDGSRLAGILMPNAIALGRGMRARDVMIPWTPEIALSADAPISSALERLAASGPGVLVVLDEGGVVRGVIDSEGVQARLGGG